MTEPLATWWEATTRAELASMLPKVTEYGSHDLQIVGEALILLNPKLAGKAHPAEVGIAFYALGKIARIIGAYADGHSPSDDTWHDLAIYARMAQRVRDADTWPGPVKPAKKKKPRKPPKGTPMPAYVREAYEKAIANHGTTP